MFLVSHSCSRFSRTLEDQRNSPVNRQYLIELIRITVPAERLLASGEKKKKKILTYGMSELQGSSTSKAQRLLFVY